MIALQGPFSAGRKQSVAEEKLAGVRSTGGEESEASTKENKVLLASLAGNMSKIYGVSLF